MVIPSKNTFKAYHAEYDMIPVINEIMFDTETPISLADRFSDSEYSVLLESVEGGEKWARYSFIGRDPVEVYRIKDGRIEIIRGSNIQVIDDKDPLAYLEELTKARRMPEIEQLPRFCSGLVGYFSYETAGYVENIPCTNADDPSLPEVLLMRFDEIYVFDHLKHTLMMIVVSDTTGSDPDLDHAKAVSRLEQMESELEFSNMKKQVQASHVKHDFEIDVSKDEFVEMVERAREYIHEGDIFQVVLSQRLSTKTNADPFHIYRMLRMINPSPYMFCLKMGGFSMVGASPEMLIRVNDGVAETCPIAGTRRRGETKEEEQRLEEELLGDEKETAEHMMLVDLGRNDIGRISEPGSVVVENLKHIEKFSHVMHIVTNVKGNLKSELTSLDALMSVLPAGTLSGAPKIRAMEIIDELEKHRRGPYGGAAGYFSLNGNADFCITIRTIVIKDGMAYIQSGAGIVADSKPEREYEETREKAMAMLNAIERAGG